MALSQDAISLEQAGNYKPYIQNADGTITFQYASNKAKRVEIVTQYGERKDMFPSFDTGLWTAKIPAAKPDIYPYYYVVDGINCMDPRNNDYFPNEGFKNNLLFIKDPSGKQQFYDVKSVNHGSVDYVNYWSNTLGANNRAVVYLPPSYSSNPDKKYPVYYLISGTTDTEEVFVKVGRVNYILDNLIAEGKCKEMIVVMPYGNPAHLLLPEQLKHKDLNEMFNKDFNNDLMPFIEKNYRTINDANNRAIGGFSRGGNQGLYNGLAHLDKFSYLTSYSSFTTINNLQEVYNDPITTNKKIHLFYLGVGTDDFLYGSARDYMEFLDKKGIRTVKEFTKDKFGHSWMNCRYFLSRTLPLLFNPAASEMAMKQGTKTPAATGTESKLDLATMSKLFPKPIVSPEYNDGMVTFRFKGEWVEYCDLKISGIDKPIPMAKDRESKIFSLSISSKKEDIYDYHFIADGKLYTDPENMEVSPNKGFQESIYQNPYNEYNSVNCGNIPHSIVRHDMNTGDIWCFPENYLTQKVKILIILGTGDNESPENWFKMGAANIILDKALNKNICERCILTTCKNPDAFIKKYGDCIIFNVNSEGKKDWNESRQQLLSILSSMPRM